mmetsp:Transcript_80382/g.93821  ORF Transcript_80382/g.93821 Transcript_80382/m.93821 type:complete len:229 (+) Transcript_80382:471-1157(+)
MRSSSFAVSSFLLRLNRGVTCKISRFETHSWRMGWRRHLLCKMGWLPTLSLTRSTWRTPLRNLRTNLSKKTKRSPRMKFTTTTFVQPCREIIKTDLDGIITMGAPLVVASGDTAMVSIRAINHNSNSSNRTDSVKFAPDFHGPSTIRRTTRVRIPLHELLCHMNLRSFTLCSFTTRPSNGTRSSASKTSRLGLTRSTVSSYSHLDHHTQTLHTVFFVSNGIQDLAGFE